MWTMPACAKHIERWHSSGTQVGINANWIPLSSCPSPPPPPPPAELIGDCKCARLRSCCVVAADKNQDNLQAAEERFKEIQNAYEVLGDAHERSW